MSETQLVRLGDHVDLLVGFAFKSGGFTEDPDGTRLVRGDNIGHGRLRWERCRRWPSDDGSVAAFRLREGDAVVAMDRPWIETGLKFGVVRSEDLPALLVQRVARLRAGPGLDQGYLGSLISSAAFAAHVRAVQTGTTIPHISGRQIQDFRFLLPPMREQRLVANALRSIEDKIGLNDRLVACTDELLACEFSEALSTFDIDAGDNSRPLIEIAAVLETGSRPRGGVNQYSTGVPSIGAQSIKSLATFDFGQVKYVPVEYFESMRKGHLESRDVLLYKDGGRPGSFEPHVAMWGDGFPFDRLAINEHVFRIRARPPITQEWLYCALAHPKAMEDMRRKGTGVAVPGLNKTAAGSVAVPIPPANTLDAFQLVAEPMVGRALAAARESRSLAELRDALLPRLLSGELRVRDAEQALETVV